MTSQPLASIVVNNYNYARFLAAAIDSALAQTYRPLEVIVVDDGSTDHSRDVIARYGERIIPVLKENGGQGSAINAGFAASSGEVVVFLDADDVLLQGALEYAVQEFGDPDVVKAHWPLFEIDAVGNRTGGLQPALDLSHGDLRDAAIRDGPWAGMSAPTSGNAWARKFLERVLPMPEDELRINSDGYLATLAWIYGSVRVLAQPQSLYRIHGNNHFASKPKAERRTRLKEMYLRRCAFLADHLTRMGLEAEPDVWQANNDLCQWDQRLTSARQELQDVVPPGSRIILVDEDAWGYDPDTHEVVPGVFAFPFLERDGQFWGLPVDDVTAIAELERLRSAGAEFVVFTWATAWLLEEYPALDLHLRNGYSCRLATDLLVAFDLRGWTGSADDRLASLNQKGNG